MFVNWRAPAHHEVLALSSVLLMLVLAPRVCAAQPGSDEIGVAFSGTGGVSRGAYQAGVDWVLSEFLRRQRVDDLRRKLFGSESERSSPGARRARRFKLVSSTGASAGNVNALFMALAWCTAKRNGTETIGPEQSLFWDAWVNTGIGELLTGWDDPLRAEGHPTRDPAVFDRAFFREVHKGRLREEFSAVEAADCNVPVAMTVTKQQPQQVVFLGNTLSAAVQRFAVPFTLVSKPGSKSKEVQIDPVSDRVRESGSLGALAMLPELTDSQADRDRRLDAVFEVVLASSAFPLAFAPVSLTYRAAGLIRPPQQNRVSSASRTDPNTMAEFVDGGVFDVSPVALAVRLHERHTKPDERRNEIDLMYSNTDTLRLNAPGKLGDLADADEVAAAERNAVTPALSSAILLGKGAISSARQYERQSFAREVARINEIIEDLGGVRDVTVYPWIRQTSRFEPFFGATLQSFGGFLGRAMRERDFYAGVYDGIEAVARHFMCQRRGVYFGKVADGRAQHNEESPEFDDASPEICREREHRRLIRDNAFELEGVGRQLVARMLVREYGGWYPDVDPSVEPDRWTVLSALDTAISRRPVPNCQEVKGTWEGLACAGGLKRALDEIAAPPTSGALDRLATACDQAVEKVKQSCSKDCGWKVKLAQSGCTVDKGFVRLAKAPVPELYRLGNRVALSLLDAEESVAREDGTRSYAGPTKAFVSLYGAINHSYDHAWAVNPFAGRLWDKNHVLASIAGLVAPNYAQVSHAPERLGVGVLGWRPLVRFAGRNYFASELEWRFQRRSYDGASLAAVWGVHTRKWLLSTVEFGASRHIGDGPNEVGENNVWSARLSVRGLWEKGRVSLAFRDRRYWGITYGFSDLNGVAYWLWRWSAPVKRVSSSDPTAGS